MSKAILTISMPKSCRVCPEVDKTASTKSYYCRHIKSEYNYVTDYTSSRHPNCPLVIEEEGLRWNEIEGGNVDGWFGYSIKCPKCKKEYPAPVDDKFEEFYNYCPSCGVKLAPPLEGDDAV
jgi:DNA-directed RNA polymerase subunit RPC12/RpoP